MKWIKVLTALTALLVAGANAQAGIFGHHRGGCGAEKACGCASDCQPESCKPTIKKPCHRNVNSYQRGCAAAKPSCSDSCCPSSCCAPVACAAPACAAPTKAGCAAEPACNAPCEKTCTADPACEAPCAKDACCDTDGCGSQGCCDADRCRTKKCKDPCAKYDPCKLAQLIYESQTACYPRQRKHAVHKIGSRFSCACNPEVMTALIYAMNDANPYVRREAADEIGDQLRKHGCGCSPDLVTVLTCALADCDRGVRREAEQALNCCGYEVIDGCCKAPREKRCRRSKSCCDKDECGCGDTGCCPSNECAPAATYAKSPTVADKTKAPAEKSAAVEDAPEETEDVPAPPTATKPENNNYFPAKIRKSDRPVKRNTLANLFGFLD